MRRFLIAAILFAGVPRLLAQSNYQRAEQLLTWNAMRLVYHDQVLPTWYRDSTRFWYRVHTRSGFEFMTVNPTTGTKAPLFDNARLAAALSVAADTAFDPGKLPFPTVTFDQDGKDESALRLRIGKRGFRCELAGYRCAAADTLPDRTRFVRSPDDRWDAFVSGYDLWVRPAARGRLDPTHHRRREGLRLRRRRRRDPPRSGSSGAGRPTIVWSPDSKRLAVMRYDERAMTMFHLIS